MGPKSCFTYHPETSTWTFMHERRPGFDLILKQYLIALTIHSRIHAQPAETNIHCANISGAENKHQPSWKIYQCLLSTTCPIMQSSHMPHNNLTLPMPSIKLTYHANQHQISYVASDISTWGLSHHDLPMDISVVNLKFANKYGQS